MLQSLSRCTFLFFNPGLRRRRQHRKYGGNTEKLVRRRRGALEWIWTLQTVAAVSRTISDNRWPVLKQLCKLLNWVGHRWLFGMKIDSHSDTLQVTVIINLFWALAQCPGKVKAIMQIIEDAEVCHALCSLKFFNSLLRHRLLLFTN